MQPEKGQADPPQSKHKVKTPKFRDSTDYDAEPVTEDKGEVFLLLENLLSSFKQPCVMDMKMGKTILSLKVCGWI